jgi:exonuclease SbcC
MLLVSLSLENIKSYQKVDFEFRHGLTAIIGRNGAGKSTILEAIGYALFHYLRLKNTAKLIRSGERTGQIELVFKSPRDDRQYKIIRKLRRAKYDANKASSSVEIIDQEDGGTIVSSVEEAQKFIKEHLGLDELETPLPDIFSNVVGVPQGRLLADFSTTGEARRAIFDPIMGTKQYKESVTKLREPLNKLEKRIMASEAKIDRLRSLIEPLPQLNVNYIKLLAEEDETKKNLACVTNKKERVEDSLKSIRKRGKGIDEATLSRDKALQSKKTAMHELKKSRNKLIELRYAASKRDSLKIHHLRYTFLEETELPRIREEVNRLSNLESKLKTTKALLAKEEDDLRNETKNLDDLKDLESELLVLQKAALKEEADDNKQESKKQSLQNNRGILKAKLALLATHAEDSKGALAERDLLARELEGEAKAPATGGYMKQVINLALKRGYRLVELLNEKIALGDPDHRLHLQSQIRSLDEQIQGCKPFEALARSKLAYAERKIADELPKVQKAYAKLSTEVECRLKAMEAIQKSIGPLSGLGKRLAHLENYRDELRDYNHDYIGLEMMLAKDLGAAKRNQKQAFSELRIATGTLSDKEIALQQMQTGADAEMTEIQISELEHERSKLDNASGRLGNELKGLKEKQEETTTEIEKLNQNAEDLRQKECHLKQSRSLERLLSLLREAINITGPQITRLVLNNLSHAASELYRQILDDYSLSLQWQEDYEIVVHAAGHNHTFEELSGGEQVTAALAVRLAMLKELLHFDLAFLDEPTQNLDGQKRDNLASQVRDLRGFTQLFVISHDDTFERYLQNIISINKTRSISSVAPEFAN